MVLETKNVIGNTLSWIVVKDLDAAIAFYTEVVGLELKEKTPEYGWAELSGDQGARLGIAEESEMNPIKSGQNAVMAINVLDVKLARDQLVAQGATLLGDIDEIPGHVKMQTFRDASGNVMQVVENLN